MWQRDLAIFWLRHAGEGEGARDVPFRKMLALLELAETRPLDVLVGGACGIGVSLGAQRRGGYNDATPLTTTAQKIRRSNEEIFLSP